MIWVPFVDRALVLLGVELRELQLASAGSLVERHYPSLSPDRPALIGDLDSVDLCQQLGTRLAQVYPKSHKVTVIAGLDAETAVRQELSLDELDRAVCQGISLVYLPPLECPGAVETFQSTVAHLRAPDGCPWDRQQTHQSLREGFLEEAYEVLDALDQGDVELLKEELGDVLLHILLQAQIASERGEFSMSDVVCHANSKIVYRHPHVFGDLTVDGVDQVLHNWEELKRKEKGRDEEVRSLFDGIPRALPALARAQALLRRAERLDVHSVERDTLAGEVEQAVQQLAADQEGRAREQLLGDLLFALTALATSVQIDAEGTLRNANARFERRVLSSAAEHLGASREVGDP